MIRGRVTFIRYQRVFATNLHKYTLSAIIFVDCLLKMTRANTKSLKL